MRRSGIKALQDSGAPAIPIALVARRPCTVVQGVGMTAVFALIRTMIRSIDTANDLLSNLTQGALVFFDKSVVFCHDTSVV